MLHFYYYYYCLVAIFTRRSVLVNYAVVLDLAMEASRLQVCVFQASRCIHLDTVACLVDRSKMRKKKKEGFWGGLTMWHFSGHMT